MSKLYNFCVIVRYGYGEIVIEADNEDEAYDKLGDFIDEKMTEAELTIDYDIELENPDDDDEGDDNDEEG